VKVMIVDDEPAMLLVFKRMLAKIDGVELVACHQRVEQALSFVQTNEVDLAILDIMIASDNGLQLARSLRAANRNLHIVFTTSSTEYALDAYDVYPLDYIVKPISSVRLAQTIARAGSNRGASLAVDHDDMLVAEEQTESSEKETETETEAEQTIVLTTREKEVLQGIAAGQSNEEIAQLLEISLSTVKVHTRNVFHKLDVRNRVSAVVRAQQLSLLDEQ